MKSRTITIHLAKDDLDRYEDALKLPDMFDRFDPDDDHEEEPVLFVKQHPANPPRWKLLLDEAFDLSALNLSVRSVSAVLFLKVRERTFAITFGHGWSMLDDGRFVEDFGLKAALGAVAPDELRNVDVMRPETAALRKRQQTGRSSRLDEFEIDQLVDVIRSVTGRAADDGFAKKATGSSSLKLSAELDFAGLGRKCAQALDLFESDAYQASFAMIDQLRPVSDPVMIGTLDQLLLGALNNAEFERVYLSPPEIIDETAIVGFKFQGTWNKTLYSDLDITDYFAGRRTDDDIELETLKAHHVEIQFEVEGTSFPRWKLYKCIIFEVSHGGHQYILSEGSWYRVDTDFRDRVIDFYESKVVQSGFPDAGVAESEPAYCARVCGRDGRILFDRQTFRVPGEATGYELCDILTDERVLLHTKPGEKGSSTLSHLFRQGVMAGELLAREPEFRNQVRDYLTRVAAENVELIPVDQPNARDYTIRFGVIAKRRRDGTFDIPFFSKVSFQHSARRLGAYGFNVDLCFIERVDEEAAG
ncbi:MAG: hypothetical protein FVQ81_09690 [Candidatus Glassbacteria bacterium]|nr:hypothetical protein [Candidatus Glassbacteria bacterium]